MTTVNCFEPIARSDARILILGSMPGVESLNQQQYYAHPRNSFWYIMSRLFDVPPDSSYQARTDALKKHRVALWDVLNSCIRPGSLDTSILNNSVITNDFHAFLVKHHQIRHIFFNGVRAEKEFQRHVLPTLEEKYKQLQYHRLPSTSPAMASMNRDEKFDAWQQIKHALKEYDE